MIKAKFIQIWAEHGDGGEHGTGPVIGYCSSEHLAKEVAKKKGWYGGNGEVRPADAAIIDGAVYVLAQRRPVDLDGTQAAQDGALRQTAMAKLTPEEIRVLGLSKKD